LNEFQNFDHNGAHRFGNEANDGTGGDS